MSIIKAISWLFSKVEAQPEKQAEPAPAVVPEKKTRAPRKTWKDRKIAEQWLENANFHARIDYLQRELASRPKLDLLLNEMAGLQLAAAREAENANAAELRARAAEQKLADAMASSMFAFVNVDGVAQSTTQTQ